MTLPRRTSVKGPPRHADGEMMRDGTAEHPSPHRLAARSAGLMMLAGAALVAITVLLPPRASGSDLLILGFGGVAALLGLALLLRREPLPEPALGVTVAIGTALITLATREGGANGTGTADNGMLYLWVCLFAFNFFSLPHALAQLGLVAAGYAWIMSAVPADEAVTRWLVTVSALLVAGLLVAHLRAGRERLVAELAQRARSDALTGLLNHGSLEERAKLELARARRDGTPISVLVLDVDGFKDFNDSHGHRAGDAVLRSIARELERETRQVDAIARPGGDEFAVLLPGANAEDAKLVADRLLRVADGPGMEHVTLSIGVASGPPADGSFATLWEQADAAMYEAKRSGGNAVGVHDATPAQGLAQAG